MQNRFAEWKTDHNAVVRDNMDECGRIYVGDETCDYYGVYLSPTDIKRLMECVERWEADERSES